MLSYGKNNNFLIFNFAASFDIRYLEEAG